MRCALFQPDIAGNVGTIIRLTSCLGLPLDIVEPCGFPLGDRQLRRAAMDYAGKAPVQRHADWQSYEASRKPPARIILLTSSGDCSLYDFVFRPDDIVLLGSESAGVPAHIHDAADARITIPMQPGFRSLNVAVAAAMALGEATRQLGLPVIDAAH